MTEMEIKLNVLQMAKDISVDKFFNKKEVRICNWQAGLNVAEKSGKEYPDWKSNLDFPDEDEVIKMAKLFNDFIFG
jgi:hypothetical protein